MFRAEAGLAFEIRLAEVRVPLRCGQFEHFWAFYEMSDEVIKGHSKHLHFTQHAGSQGTNIAASVTCDSETMFFEERTAIPFPLTI